MSFSIHPQLSKDCICVGETELCEVLMLNERQFPWLVLVPKREDISELFELTTTDQLKLATETNQAGEIMMAFFAGDKLNIGVLGNIVPQLHVHVIVRFKDDPVWPKPVWGNYIAKPYSNVDLDAMSAKYHSLLGDLLLA